MNGFIKMFKVCQWFAHVRAESETQFSEHSVHYYEVTPCNPVVSHSLLTVSIIKMQDSEVNVCVLKA